MFLGKAKALYTKLIADYPGSAVAASSKRQLVSLGVIFKDANEVQNAFTNLVSDFNDVNGVSEQIFAIGEQYYARAQSCQKRKDVNGTKDNYAKAIQTWEQIIKRPMKSKSLVVAEAHYATGLCYRALGEYQKAADAFANSYLLEPNFQYADYCLFENIRCYSRLARESKISSCEAFYNSILFYNELTGKFSTSKYIPYAQRWLSVCEVEK